MRKILYSCIALLFFSITLSARDIVMTSPDGQLTATIEMNADGTVAYRVSFAGQQVIRPSALGMDLRDSDLFDSSWFINCDSSQLDETWEPVWGEESKIRNHYKQYVFTFGDLVNKSITYRITFRIFNDGMGFRYEFPMQDGLNYFIIQNELTEFNMTGDHRAFWIPGDYDTNEFQYSTTYLSGVDRSKNPTANGIHAATPYNDYAVQTPLMLKTQSGLYINIHEAALKDYPAMQLDVNRANYSLKAHLVPDAVGNKAYLQTDCSTPWRTIIIGKKATDILKSRIVLNLNDPAPPADYTWIRPMKYIGIWWELHVNRSSWNYANSSNTTLNETDWNKLSPNGRHGANNDNVKKYIDFAAAHGFRGVLVEGWNIGWEDWFGQWKEDVFDFVTPYPDFDIRMLNKYAAEKGVGLIMHHETSASVTNYERHQDKALALMKQHGYTAAKTGYVGRVIPRGEHHDGQWMVNHYNRTATKFLAHQLMLNAHEAVRPTGLHRTYPNWLASESARGMEFNAWSIGNPPEHETILPFTRLIGGPMDYTPGILQTQMSYYDANKTESTHTTLAKQLALYVTVYSPLQMAADLPENYVRFADAFQFIKDVPVEWERTLYIDAEPGDYVYIARKDKYSNNWFLGCITDEVGRKANIKLNFLEPGKDYKATIYADAKDAHYDHNPMQYKIVNVLVNSKSTIPVILAPGGGTAVTIQLASAQDKKELPRVSSKTFLRSWENK